MSVEDEIREFFETFGRASEEKDWPAYGAMFLDQFMNLDPSTAGVVASDALVAFLPQRDALFARAGAIGTELADVQVQPLDDTHALARTRWRVTFTGDRPDAELDSTFLLRRTDGWRIAVYLNHKSVLDVLGLADPSAD